MRRLAATALAGAVLAAVGGCGDGGEAPVGGQPEATDRPERIAVAAGAAPRTLDPARASRRSERIIAAAIQTPLLTHPHRTGNDAASLVPGLARDLPRLTEDRQEYRFSLRPGLVYADGRLVNASDVERAIAHALKVSPDPLVRDVLGGIVGAPSTDGETLRGVRTDDRSGVVVVRLREPDGRLPLVLADPATAPIPELPSEAPGALPPSTGPLRVARLTDDSVELVANPLRAKIDDVPAARTAQIAVVDGDVSSQDLSDGTIGVALASGGLAGPFTPPGTSAVTATSGSVWALLLPADGRFASRPLREAVAKAVDRRPLREAPAYRAACGLYPSWIVGAVTRDDCPPVPVTGSGNALLGEEIRIGVPPAGLVLLERSPGTTSGASSATGTTPTSGTTPVPGTTPMTASSRPDTPLGVVAGAIESLGGTILPRAGGISPEKALADGLADAALVRITPALPHPAEYLAPVVPLDTLISREAQRLQATPLTGSSGKWSALERRVLARAVVVPIASDVDAATVAEAVEPRSVVLHPVLGLDLAALRLR